MENAIRAELRTALSDAVRMTEVHKVLRDYINRTRGLLILVGLGAGVVVESAEMGERLFESASYTACLEWALKQPVIRADQREPLADISHDIWSHWMRWMFTVGTFNEDGTWTMPAEKVERWKRQMNTPYAELSEQERESDREQADKILKVLSGSVTP